MDQIYAKAESVGLKKTELAAQAGIDASVVARSYRRGKISLESLQALAGVVGLTVTLSAAQSELASKLEAGSLF
ncbi:hypothetical protein [Andreprevotia chitinilytica]|uniref:hypothetical protein n=1 Tax=Andreprevotia chitinilytica TaxID=396808 RepID=UPI0012ECB905|nr:hypothetical protein [Andreprevotia chitinilytica]